MKAIVYPAGRLEGVIDPPSSKNYTTRYLLAASLCEGASGRCKPEACATGEGASRILYPAESEDSSAMVECCRALGAEFTPIENGFEVRGFGRNPRNPGVLNPRNAGAVARFLMGPASFLDKIRIETDYPDSLGKRPHGDLLAALNQIGVRSESSEGRLPITLWGGHIRGGKIKVSGATSSQYLSALLFLAPLLEGDSEIEVTGGLKSKAPVRTTLAVLREAGIQAEASEDLLHFKIPGGQRIQEREYVLPGDYPGASAILSAAAVVPSLVTVRRLRPDDEQGEREAVRVLAKMGARVWREDDLVTVIGGRPLRSVEFDGDRATDAVLALSAAAAFAEGRSRFYNVENLRHKECDRIGDFVAELRKAGVRAEEGQAEIVITGSPKGYPGGVNVDAHHDHRVIMALTIIGLGSKTPITIHGAEHVAKSYPKFFDDLRSLGARIDLVE